MAVITFRKPEEGLDYYKQVIDLVTILRDLTNNPDVTNNIQELSDQVSTALELSEDKKKQLQEAQEIIAQSQEFLDEFERTKKEHSAKVLADLTEIKNTRDRLQNDIVLFSGEKASLLKQIEKSKSVSEEELAKAKKLNDSTVLQQKALEGDQKELESQKKDHENQVLEFEKSQIAKESSLAARLSDHEKNVQKLNDDRAAFELRKKKFDSFLKEAE